MIAIEYIPKAQTGNTKWRAASLKARKSPFSKVSIKYKPVILSGRKSGSMRWPLGSQPNVPEKTIADTVFQFY